MLGPYAGRECLSVLSHTKRTMVKQGETEHGSKVWGSISDSFPQVEEEPFYV